MSEKEFEELKVYLQSLNLTQLNAFSTGFVVFEKLNRTQDAEKFLEVSKILEERLSLNA